MWSRLTTSKWLVLLELLVVSAAGVLLYLFCAARKKGSSRRVTSMSPLPAGYRQLIEGRLVAHDVLAARAARAYEQKEAQRRGRQWIHDLRHAILRCVGVRCLDTVHALGRGSLCTVSDDPPPHLLLGLTLAGITAWLFAHPECQDGYDLQRLAAASVASAGGASPCEQLLQAGSEHAGPATVFVSCPRGVPTTTLLSTLAQWLEQHPELPRDAHGACTERFWICGVIPSLHRHSCRPWSRTLTAVYMFPSLEADLSSRSASELNAHRYAPLRVIIHRIGITLLVLDPWNEPGYRSHTPELRLNHRPREQSYSNPS